MGGDVGRSCTVFASGGQGSHVDSYLGIDYL